MPQWVVASESHLYHMYLALTPYAPPFASMVGLPPTVRNMVAQYVLSALEKVPRHAVVRERLVKLSEVGTRVYVVWQCLICCRGAQFLFQPFVEYMV